MSRDSDQQPTPPGPARDPAPDSAEPSVSDVTADRRAMEERHAGDEGDEGRAPTRPGPQGEISPEEVREHLRRRAVFLRELAEARELRRRVTPHRSRRARIHAALRRRTFRIN
ncbi:hypothetical protein [Actinomadura sp. WMMB 499]|uniref:hypothetical protein n=1 Tax=Actinomadura sp. WMMB 499 TaxID=1219491 RepID=UPI001245C2C9|nr:hypothetical protein [Actinomadura sp. WMMB 499]QFG23233.1 hypothetical protein F7P10_21030 [Actinomadura sp. WMMB 499]